MIYIRFEDIPFNYELPYRVCIDASDITKNHFNKYKRFVEDEYRDKMKHYAGCLYPKRQFYIQFEKKEDRQRFIQTLAATPECYKIEYDGNVANIKIVPYNG